MRPFFWSSLPKNSQAKWIECILDLLRNVQSTKSIWKFICTLDDQTKKNYRPLSRNKRALDFLCTRKSSFIYERVIGYLIFVSLKQNFCFVLLLELTDNNRKDSGLVFPFFPYMGTQNCEFFFLNLSINVREFKEAITKISTFVLILGKFEFV